MMAVFILSGLPGVRDTMPALSAHCIPPTALAVLPLLVLFHLLLFGLSPLRHSLFSVLEGHYLEVCRNIRISTGVLRRYL